LKQELSGEIEIKVKQIATLQSQLESAVGTVKFLQSEKDRV